MRHSGQLKSLCESAKNIWSNQEVIGASTKDLKENKERVLQLAVEKNSDKSWWFCFALLYIFYPQKYDFGDIVQ